MCVSGLHKPGPQLVCPGVVLTPTRRTLFSQTVEILVLSLRAHSATARVLGALALRAMDSDGVFGSRNV